MTRNDECLEWAHRMVKPRGTLVLTSTFQGQNKVDLTSVVVAEIDFPGSRCEPLTPSPPLPGMGLVDVESSITTVDSLDEAVQRARGRDSLRLLFRP
jgi:threonine dehydrogenase-like Zn-dependent dehydrogenase